MISLNKINAEDMKEIHKGNFPLPDLNNPANIAFRSIIDNGRLVAIGIVRYTTESILITNEDTPKVTRARAAEVIVKELAEEVKKRGLYESHVFVKSPLVHRFLKHFGFIDCNAGEPMVILF